jgi:hypothetical protein
MSYINGLLLPVGAVRPPEDAKASASKARRDADTARDTGQPPSGSRQRGKEPDGLDSVLTPPPPT